MGCFYNYYSKGNAIKNQPTLEELNAQGKKGVLYVLRGVPGSGKSFRAAELVSDPANIFSADKWFSPTDDYEEYRRNWSPEKLQVAHSFCKESLTDAMRRGISPVSVDNTNILCRDFLPYVELAEKYQYMCLIEESRSPWWLEIKELLSDTCANAKLIEEWAKKLSEGFEHNGRVIKNGHGVPEQVILRMLMKFQPYKVF